MDKIRQKAEALDNSRPLYMWRLSDFPQAKAAVDHVFNEVLSAGLVKKRFQSKWRDLTRAIVLDLFVAYKIDPGMYIGYSRNPNMYKINSRYGAWFLSGTILVKLIDFLHRKGYIEHHAGFRSESKSRRSRMRATEKLISVFEQQHKVTLPMVRHNPDEQVIILRDADKNDIEYEDTPEVVRMRENLHRINASLEKHAILLFIKNEELVALQARLNRKINFADKRLRRVFNNSSWTQGGRFFGGWWQNIPREYRQFIRINGKDVVECDYSGLHINMLYAMSKISMPEGDVYHLPGYSNNGVFRDFVKRVLLIMVNSKDRNVSRKALHSEVHFDRTLTLPEEIPSTRAADLNPLMDAFEEKHEPIRHYFCTGVGIDLQYRDSLIAEQVLLRFSRNYAILPLHDSFIIHHGLETGLQEAMNEAFKAEFEVDAKVEIKFNTLDLRNKNKQTAPAECTLSLREIMMKYKPWSIHEGLLEEHRRLQQSRPTLPPSQEQSTDEY